MIEMRTRRPAAEIGIPPPPVVKPKQRVRVLGVDAARGVALLGMMAIHSLPEAAANGQPTWSYLIFAGRASAVFAVLAGVGIAFMTGRARVRRTIAIATAAALGVRALVIGAIGLALGYADATLGAVILPAFAMMLVLAIPLVFLPTWAVAVSGVVLMAGAPALSHVLLPRLSEPVLENPTFGHLADNPVGLLVELSLTGAYPALPWLAYLCAGLVIGRLSLSGRTAALGLLATGLLIANAASIASSVLLHRYGGLARIMAAQPESGLTASETTAVLTFGSDGTVPTSTWWWLAVDSPHTSTPLDLMATTGIAVALLGVMLLAGSITSTWWRRLVAVVRTPLAAAGGMTLTFYTAHIIFINSEYDMFDSITGYFLQVTAVLLIGFIWRGTTVRGPLEAFVAEVAARVRRWVTPASRRPSSQLTAATVPVFPQNVHEVNEEFMEPLYGPGRRQ